MKSIFLFILFGVLTISPLGAGAKDCREVIPPNDDWAFVTVLLQSGLNPTERTLAMEDACHELDLNHRFGVYYQTFQTPEKIQKHAETVAKYSGGDPKTTVGGTPQQDRYKAELDAIGDRDPLVRLQKIYDLAIRYQGEYEVPDHPRTPGEIIDSAHKTGKGGVSREFANLLLWSLRQKSNIEPALAVEFVLGQGNKLDGSEDGAHDSLRIKLPARGPQPLQVFDLDSSWYNKRFTPVMLRYQNRNHNDVRALHKTCLAIHSCLANSQAKVTPGKRLPAKK